MTASARDTVSSRAGQSLLESYGAGEVFFYATDDLTLSAGHVHEAARVHVVPECDAVAGVLEALRAASLRGEADLVAAAIPFDVRRGAVFSLLRAPRVRAGRSVALRDAPDLMPATALVDPRRCQVAHAPEPAAYAAAVSEALSRIADTELAKVVLARSMTISVDEPLDRAAVLRALGRQNPRGTLFAMDVNRPAEPRTTLLGVSPELLIERRGRIVRTQPLAGSRPRGRTPQEDSEQARVLLGSEKDLREHAIVVEAIRAVLGPRCARLRVPSAPGLVATETMWHLATSIEGELLSEEESVLELALALHPTPAVCGHPKQAALAAIAELEGFDRGLFAGAIGHCDARGDGRFAVTLRCAELGERSIRLCAGAGIVRGSVPWDEVAETDCKLDTVLAALRAGRRAG
jgi:isochorismate synthase